MSDVYTALAAIQANRPELLRDGRGQYGAYLTLGNLLDAIIPMLNEQKLVLTQMPTTVDGQPALRTRLTHPESETFIEDTMLLMSAQANPQQQGSAITYARRYAVNAMFSLFADADDDGQSATNAVRATTTAVVEPRRATARHSNGASRPAETANPF